MFKKNAHSEMIQQQIPAYSWAFLLFGRIYKIFLIFFYSLLFFEPVDRAFGIFRTSDGIHSFFLNAVTRLIPDTLTFFV